jgi:hypothetical protein
MRHSTALVALVSLLAGAAVVACSSSGGSSSGTAGNADGGPGSSGTSGTSGTSGAGGALPVSTFLYVSAATPDHDVLSAYDVESGAARTITDLTGDGSQGWNIRGYGLSPDRTRIVLATLYGPTQADNDTKLATRRLWSAAVDGSDFRRLTPVFENTAAGRQSFTIEVGDPSFSKDGADVLFSYGEYFYEGTTLKGGAGLWSVKAAGASLPAYIQSPVSCSILHPTVDPKTGKIVVIHSVCTGSKDGLYMYAPDGSGAPETLVQDDFAAVQVSLETPSWAADGSGFVFVGTTSAKVDGADAVVRGLFAFDMVTRKVTPVIVPDQPDTAIDSVAAAPDARAIVYCLRHGDARDLHIIDLTKNPATDAALTNDGKSCHPVW